MHVVFGQVKTHVGSSLVRFQEPPFICVVGGISLYFTEQEFVGLFIQLCNYLHRICCRFSIESQKRNSFDSTVSMQAVEVTKTMRQIPRSKRRREERKAKRESRKEAKQSSNASQMSNLEMEVGIRISHANERWKHGLTRQNGTVLKL